MNRRQAIASLLALPIAVKAVPAAPERKFSGWVRNFGNGMPTVLHGSEAIIPQSVAHHFVSLWADMPLTKAERMRLWPEIKD